MFFKKKPVPSVKSLMTHVDPDLEELPAVELTVDKADWDALARDWKKFMQGKVFGDDFSSDFLGKSWEANTDYTTFGTVGNGVSSALIDKARIEAGTISAGKIADMKIWLDESHSMAAMDHSTDAMGFALKVVKSRPGPSPELKSHEDFGSW